SIVTVTENLAKEFEDLAPSVQGKISVITNGFDPDDISSPKAIVHSNRFVLAHAGNLFTRNSLPYLEGLAHFLSTHPEAKHETRAVFWGPRDPKTEDTIEKLRLSDIYEHRGWLLHEAWLEAVQEVSVFLLIQSYGPIDRVALPGKLFEYAALARPIVGFG